MTQLWECIAKDFSNWTWKSSFLTGSTSYSLQHPHLNRKWSTSHVYFVAKELIVKSFMLVCLAICEHVFLCFTFHSFCWFFCRSSNMCWKMTFKQLNFFISDVSTTFYCQIFSFRIYIFFCHIFLSASVLSDFLIDFPLSFVHDVLYCCLFTFFLFNEFTCSMLSCNVYYNIFDGNCLLHFAKPGLNFH